MFENQARAER
jgi:hypothetical protein